MTKEIILVGDWGSEDNKCKHAFHKEKHDEIVLLGDNFYPSGVVSHEDVQWNTKYEKNFPHSSKKYAVLGNHDYLGDVFSQISYTFHPNNKNWYMPHFFYDEIDKENDCHHIFIDSCLFDPQITTLYSQACNIKPENEQQYFGLVFHFQKRQKNWLEKILKETKCRWKIVYGHYPILSNGPHQQAYEFVSIVKPLLEKYNVDIYACGHDHNCQILRENNVTYLVTGGSNYHEYTRPIPQNFFTSDKTGFIKLSIDSNTINIEHCDSNQIKHHIFSISKYI